MKWQIWNRALQLELSFGNKPPLGIAFGKNLVESRNLKELYD